MSTNSFSDSMMAMRCPLRVCHQWSGSNWEKRAQRTITLSGVEIAALDIGGGFPAAYSGHSLRAGLATAAGDRGAGLAELMRQTRHKSNEVALGYLRSADLWRNDVTEWMFEPLAK